MLVTSYYYYCISNCYADVEYECYCCAATQLDDTMRRRDVTTRRDEALHTPPEVKVAVNDEVVAAERIPRTPTSRVNAFVPIELRLSAQSELSFTYNGVLVVDRSWWARRHAI